MSNYLTKKRNELLKKIDSIKKWILSNNHNNETEKCISILNELKREVEINATKKFGLLGIRKLNLKLLGCVKAIYQYLNFKVTKRLSMEK